MQRTPIMIVAVGIFFVVGILLLFILSLRSGGNRVHGGYTLFTEVKDARGLERGADVLLAGVPVGAVEKVTLSEDRNRVRIQMSIRRDIEVRKDAVASIQLKSLLGTYFVHLTHGSAQAGAAAPDTVIASAEVVDVNDLMRSLSEAGGDIQGLISSVNKNQQEFFEKINGVIDENRGNLKTVTDALSKSAPKVENFFDAVSTVSRSLSSGKGTIGKLMTSDEVYNDLKASGANIRSITAQVRSGKGALGRIVYDDAMSSQLAATMRNISDAAEVVQSLRESAPGIKTAVNNFAEVSEKINKGQGTLGKLVNDPTLYNDTQRAIGQIRKTFEEGEEQSVMRTFLGVFFGSMI